MNNDNEFPLEGYAVGYTLYEHDGALRISPEHRTMRQEDIVKAEEQRLKSLGHTIPGKRPEPDTEPESDDIRRVVRSLDTGHEPSAALIELLVRLDTLDGVVMDFDPPDDRVVLSFGVTVSNFIDRIQKTEFGADLRNMSIMPSIMGRIYEISDRAEEQREKEKEASDGE